MKKEYAKLITRRGSFFPFRNGRYFDFSPWGGGHLRRTGAPGAIVIDASKGILGNIRTGEVYRDTRFETEDAR